MWLPLKLSSVCFHNKVSFKWGLFVITLIRVTMNCEQDLNSGKQARTAKELLFHHEGTNPICTEVNRKTLTDFKGSRSRPLGDEKVATQAASREMFVLGGSIALLETETSQKDCEPHTHVDFPSLAACLLTFIQLCLTSQIRRDF